MLAPFFLRFGFAVSALALVITSAHASGMVGLLNLTFEGNPLLQSQSRLIGAAQSDVKGSKWQFYPTPSVSVEQANASSADPSYSKGDGRVVVLRLQQPLWTAGRLTAGVNRAEAAVAVAQAQFEESRQQLALRTIAAWGEWKSGEQKALALKENVQTHQRLAALIARRVEGGLSAVADSVLAQGRLEQARAEAAVAQAQQASALARLEQLTGRRLEGQSLESLVIMPVEPVLDLAPSLEKAWTNSPTATKLQAQIRQQEMDVEIRKAQLMPEVYARAEHQQGSFTAGGPSSANRFFIGLSATPGAGLSAQTGVEAAVARVEALRAEVESSRRALIEQVTLEHVSALAQVQRRQSLEAGLGLTRDMVASWDRQFLAGRKTWVEVMNAARELSQAQTSLAEVNVAYVMATWRLVLLVEGVPGVLSGLGPPAAIPSR